MSDRVDADIKVGDVAIDLVERGKVQVVGRAAETVAEHETREDYDISAYKGNVLLNVQGDEPVWECVYLPDNPTTSVSGTYDFPASRLARVPVEEANQDLRRFQRDLVVDVLAAVLRQVDSEASGEAKQTVEAAIEGAVGSELAGEAVELAAVGDVVGGGDGVE